jgi:hypothetical protein
MGFYSSSKHGNNQGIPKGKYHYTVDLLFDWFGLVCFANKNKNCHLSYSWFQTSQTGGQWYSYTSPFSIPCNNCLTLSCCVTTKLGRFMHILVFFLVYDFKPRVGAQLYNCLRIIVRSKAGLLNKSLMLSSSFRYDQIYKYEIYDFGHTLLCYLRRT